MRHLLVNRSVETLQYGILMMSQETGLDQWISNQFRNFDDMRNNTADFIRWSQTRLNI